ncbi:hypothetical protein BJF92_03610 [Rhizobium rhizosphaerae]|uniref:LemA family protein n=1 Tax=Xaviernesmea rhizosphaerae TaxID=1672749 RepID=A0A1Q9AH56_9HYPH|nr:LemA family protein [Xaviernesmea rhizosphaerae]OLP54505.1 hypothetical protein BJF92_03610 [Xaviernesmea rhizosphaerae]
MSALIALILPVLLVALWMALLVRSLLRARRAKEAAWAALDLPLRRRMDLVPPLAAWLEARARPEGARLRALYDRGKDLPEHATAERMTLDTHLSQALARLFTLAETDPDLKQDAEFSSLRAGFAAAEADLQGARRGYNAAARDLNALIESFPANLLAGSLGLAKAQYIELAPRASD